MAAAVGRSSPGEKNLRRILWVAALLLLALLQGRTFAASSRQRVVPPAEVIAVDAGAVAERLARGIRLETVSHQDPAKLDRGAFLALRKVLATSYPATHAALRRETVADLSLLYEWRGRDADLAPALLLAHQDVVPVEPGTAGDWTHPPFAGVVADGFVWGRGAMDDKLALFCILEAVEALVSERFEPDRTLYVAFGHDEELGGDAGAAAIAAWFEARGIALAWVLDEGGIVTRAALPGMAADLAVVGIAEKGSLSIELAVDVAGGHSSMPPRSSAIRILSRAITALEENPPPASIGGATALFLDHVGPELPFPARVVLANRWLFGPLIRFGFGTDPRLDAMVRTTTAVTLVPGGVKSNVLPARASAVVNFRILPGETHQDVMRHGRRTIADERVKLRINPDDVPRDPSPLFPIDSDAFAALGRTIREIFPDSCSAGPTPAISPISRRTSTASAPSSTAGRIRAAFTAPTSASPSRIWPTPCVSTAS